MLLPVPQLGTEGSAGDCQGGGGRFRAGPPGPAGPRGPLLASLFWVYFLSATTSPFCLAFIQVLLLFLASRGVPVDSGADSSPLVRGGPVGCGGELGPACPGLKTGLPTVSTCCSGQLLDSLRLAFSSATRGRCGATSRHRRRRWGSYSWNVVGQCLGCGQLSTSYRRCLSGAQWLAHRALGGPRNGMNPGREGDIPS